MVRAIDREFIKAVCPPIEGTLELDQVTLSELLKTPLAQSIPIDEASYTHLLTQASCSEFSKVFTVADETGSCDVLDTRFSEMLFNSSLAVGSEDMVHSLIDSCLLHPLETLLQFAGVNEVTFQRNEAALCNFSSHTSGVRPDVYLWGEAFLLLVGEEKRSGTDRSAATKDLESKLDGWSPTLMGRTSFLVGFTACGPSLCFYAYNDKIAPLAITQSFDLSTKDARVAFVPVLFQLARLLRYQWSLKPAQRWGLLLPHKRPRTTIVFGMDKVVIEFTAGQQIRELLTLLLTQSVPYLIRPMKISRKHLKAEFVPLGVTPVRPTTPEACSGLLRCLLTALAGLHGLGWCHNDIRWPNVISHITKPNHWILIDLDHATKIGDTVQLGDWPKASVQRDLGMLQEMLVDVVMDHKLLPELSVWKSSPSALSLLEKLSPQ